MKTPGATYRLQFNREFGFRQAREQIPVLDRLGITHIYASPLFAARTGSTHGYDVTDPNRLNPALGDAAEFDRFVDDLRNRGMGLILDIVPNHMAANSENAWWMDVLESGSASPYASFFGVYWELTRQASGEKILLPLLGDHYGAVLNRGELRLTFRAGVFSVEYCETRLPIDPGTYGIILGSEAPPDILDRIRRLPPREGGEWEALAERQRQRSEIKSCLADHAGSALIEQALARYNGSPGVPRSFDALHELLEMQAYRLAHWKAATERSNYRRFFDVADYVGLRADDLRVFDAWHVLTLALIQSGKVDSLRVDHVDGLFDPEGYLQRLREHEVYVVVEKVLAADEKLPRSWPVAGTTGYDFLAAVNGLLVSAPGLAALERVYRAIVPDSRPLEDIEYERKKFVIAELFAGETQDLGAMLLALADSDRNARDLSQAELTQALIEVTACLGVYRTYIRSFEPSSESRGIISRACADARLRNPRGNELVYDFIRRVLSLDQPDPASLSLVMRWQQRTGSIMAKGVEDSAFYVHNPLTSLNEVGSWQRAVSPAEFHRFLVDRKEQWPAAFNATSTHDTKRSEDVRARISVLSELPGEWAKLTDRWRRWLRPERDAIDPNDEYLLWQTLLGAWPFDAAGLPHLKPRLQEYMTKAVREARVHSSWLRPDESYELAVRNYVELLLGHERFLASFIPFAQRAALHGAMNSLSQTLLKIASPGVPDFYQGTIGWNLALVDPDNRRPQPAPVLTDFSAPPRVLVEQWADGRIKVFVTETALAVRRGRPELFLSGDYLPLTLEGSRADHAVAFARRFAGEWAIAVAPRLTAQMSATPRFPLAVRAWRDTALLVPEVAPSRWRNAFTGRSVVARDGRVMLARLLDQFPLALLSARTDRA